MDLLYVMTLVAACVTMGSALTERVPYKDGTSKTSFTTEEITNLVYIHNAYRSVVQPTAGFMAEVEWDADIAALAQEWANNCSGAHRPNPSVGNWTGMGEALYTFFGNSYNELVAVEAFYNESRDYNYDTGVCTAGKVCGHYFTLAWNDTIKIGCGIRGCPALTNSSYTGFAVFIVCDYNAKYRLNRKAYKSGPPCSACTTTHPKCRYNLCVREELFNQQKGYDGNTTLIGISRNSAGNLPFSLGLIISTSLLLGLGKLQVILVGYTG
ncbi:glioma pathogenesis-related protein 1-like [Physella acuta]|uniref:glioma pathogenesis-related protein 1-like n=1 Tax=Physella acuta TaxID=109671 RepID=UPI0027DC962E|nr:glioma pathogenesis-related protein 1-like [Physella acuta]